MPTINCVFTDPTGSSITEGFIEFVAKETQNPVLMGTSIKVSAGSTAVLLPCSYEVYYEDASKIYLDTIEITEESANELILVDLLQDALSLIKVSFVELNQLKKDTELQVKKDRHKNQLSVIIPAYDESVLPDPSYWEVLFDALKKSKQCNIYVVFNIYPTNGAGTERKEEWATLMSKIKEYNAIPLGYIYLGYTNVNWTGRNTPATPVEDGCDSSMAVERIDAWRTLYPEIEGIFYDEVPNVNDPDIIKIFSDIRKHTEKHNMFPLISNPGTAVPREFYELDVADTIIMYESITRLPSEMEVETTYSSAWFGDAGCKDIPAYKKGFICGYTTIDQDWVNTLYQHASVSYSTPFGYKDPVNHLKDLFKYIRNY